MWSAEKASQHVENKSFVLRSTGGSKTANESIKLGDIIRALLICGALCRWASLFMADRWRPDRRVRYGIALAIDARRLDGRPACVRRHQYVYTDVMIATGCRRTVSRRALSAAFPDELLLLLLLLRSSK